MKKTKKLTNKYFKIGNFKVALIVQSVNFNIFLVDAAIVRIMKAKKELSHSELMASLFEQLRFPITPPDLKKRIEHLIDREFIERDPDSATRYRYLA